MSSSVEAFHDTRRRRRQVLAIAFVCYAFATLFLTLHHEAWGDETDSWVLMRDGGVRVMLSETAYAGTPALWYLLLAPLTSAGFPYLAQQLLNVVLMWAAMAIFVAEAPFDPAFKVLFLFSFYPFCEYAVKARPYSLLLLLLFAIAAIWRRRDDHPVAFAVLTALLANATAHGLLIAADVGALFLGDAILRRTWRRRGTLAAVGIMLAGGIVSALQLRLPGGWPVVHRYVDPGTIPWSIGGAFLPGVDPRLSFAPGLVILAIAVAAIGHRTLPLLFVTVAIAILLLLFQYIWVGGLRHTGLILVVLLAGVWIAGRDPGPERWRATAFLVFEAALALTLVQSVYAASREAVDEVRWQHSGSKEMAAYIAAHVPESTAIVAPSAIRTVAVLAYLPRHRAWYAQTGQFGSYVRWEALGNAPDRNRQVTVPMTIAAAGTRFAGHPWLLLVSNELNPPEKEHFRLLYTNRERIYAQTSERFWLYAPE